MPPVNCSLLLWYPALRCLSRWLYKCSCFASADHTRATLAAPLLDTVMTPPKPRQAADLVLLPAPDAQHPLFRLVRLLEVGDDEVAGVAATEFLVAQAASELHAVVVYRTDEVGHEGRAGIFQLRSDAVEADEGDLTGAVQVLDGVEAAERELDFRLDYFVGGDLDVRRRLRAGTNQKSPN